MDKDALITTLINLSKGGVLSWTYPNIANFPPSYITRFAVYSPTKEDEIRLRNAFTFDSPLETYIINIVRERTNPFRYFLFITQGELIRAEIEEEDLKNPALLRELYQAAVPASMELFAQVIAPIQLD